MGKITSILPIWVILACGANAQAVKPKAEAKPDPKEPILASRFVPADATDAYIARMAKILVMDHRPIDPFALLQDPNAKPIEPKRIEGTGKIVKEPSIPIGEIVGKLTVTMVKAKSKQFVVGGRTLGIGSKLPVNYKGKRFDLVVQDVSSAKIVFKNQTTGELGEYLFEQLPKGFTKGTQSVKMPGVKESSPLEIDSP